MLGETVGPSQMIRINDPLKFLELRAACTTIRPSPLPMG